MPIVINADNGIASGSVGLKYSTDNSGVLALQTSGNTAMTIDGSGNVGINTSNPSYKLDVAGQTSRLANGTTGSVFGLTTNTGGNLYFGLDQSTGGSLSAGSSGYAAVLNHTGAYSMQFGTNNTVRATIDSSGNVGIGTSSPLSATNQTSVTINGTNYGRVDLYSGGSQRAYWYGFSSGTALGAVGTNYLAFDTNSTERMRITSDGEVLVGGTTSINAATGCLTLQRTNDQPYLSFFRNDTSVNPSNSLGDIYYYGNDTTSSAVTALAAIRVLATDTHAAGDNPTDIVFQTTPDGSATIAEAGRITQSGAYVLKGGTTSPGGVGITFPATQSASSNANTLDDYEEGSWTPGVAFGGGTTGITYSSREGYYTKIGRLVFVTGIVQLTNKGSSTGIATITGLPFTVAAPDANYSGLSIGYMDGITYTGAPFLRSGSGEAVIYMGQTTEAGTGTNFSNTNFANSCFIRFAGCYQA